MRIVSLVFLLIFVVGGVGWVANISQIVGMASDPITVMLVLKCAGILLAPLGSVLGLMGLF